MSSGPFLSTHRDLGSGDLRGRTYGIPFQDVWTRGLHLVERGTAGCRLLESHDVEGVIRAEASGWFGGEPDLVVIRISLDEDVQTRVDVDLRAGSRFPGVRLRLRWRLSRILRALDQSLGV